MREELIGLLEEAAEKMDCPQMNEVADYLIANNVTILLEGAIILTRAEIDALNEYQDKRDKELAEKIFEDIEKYLVRDGYLRLISAEKFAELKKKYTEGEKENERTI